MEQQVSKDDMKYITPVDAIQKEFLAYHEKHPDIRARIEQQLLTVKAAGIQHYGSWRFFRELMESPEWTAAKPGAFKHDYMGRYVRLIMLENPALRGLLEIRPLKIERGAAGVTEVQGVNGIRHYY